MPRAAPVTIATLPSSVFAMHYALLARCDHQSDSAPLGSYGIPTPGRLSLSSQFFAVEVLMSDARVEAATRNLVYRVVGQGVEYVDFVRTTERIERWADWHDRWVEAAEVHEGLAAEAEAASQRQTAGEAYLRTALYLHFAKF